jgi:hypothetical protein
MIYKTKVIVKPANLAGKQNGLLPDTLLAEYQAANYTKTLLPATKPCAQLH